MWILRTFLIHFYIIINAVCDSQIQPHIIIIVADDVGWNDVGFHGSTQIPTPNIDALAYNGIILNRFYILTSCTPSRAALLTGQYPIRFGYQGRPLAWGEDRNLPFNISTLPRRLKSLGYATHLVGKWHLGFNYKNATPLGHGFDSHFGCWNGYAGYFDHDSNGLGMEGFDMHDNYKASWQTKGKYITNLFTEKAEELIWMHNKSKPLFLMLSHVAAHAGHDMKLVVPDRLKNDEEFAYIKDENRRLYAGMIKQLDNSVGSIITTLSKKGVLRNTILVFLSDNGAPSEGVHLYRNYGSNWPLRGQKTTVLDGGVRVPAIIYASILKKNGIVSDSLIHITDLMPTLYAAAGGNVKDLGKIDGINQWSALTENKTFKRTSLLINIDEIYNSSAIIGQDGRYKLVNGSTTYSEIDEGFFGDDGLDDSNPPYNTSAILSSPVNQAVMGNLTETEIIRIKKKTVLGNCRRGLKEYQSCRYNDFCLFDLVNDPCETINIAHESPLLVKKLERKLMKYWKSMQSQKKVFIDSKANPIYYSNTWHTWLDESNK